MKATNRFRFSLLFVFAVLIATSATISTFAQGECNAVGLPLVTTGDISAADPDQTLRMFRDGRSTTCQFNRTQTTSAGTYDHDQYSFTNTSGGPVCVQVDLDANGCGVATNQISMAAYAGTYNPTSILTNIIADPGISTGQNFATSMSFTVAAGATYVIVVHNVNAATVCPSYTFRRHITNNCRNAGFDHNNDKQADLAFWRSSASNSSWLSFSIATSGGIGVNLGSTGDVPVAADYDGDEITEPSNFRPSNGTWYLTTNPATNYGAKRWGVTGDIPVQGDYDRDGNTDLAIYRPSTMRFFILRSSDNSYQEVQLGVASDKPAVADFDGDGKTDVGVFRPSNGLWTWLTSAGNFNTHNQRLWGIGTDIPVPADYDGDGKDDIAVFRPSNGTWYIVQSSIAGGGPLEQPFGVSGDVPQPADYDGDRKADLAVFRNGTWWIQRSTAGIYVRTFGQAGDVPATYPNALQ